jgi:DNA-directed RNA polymerase
VRLNPLDYEIASVEQRRLEEEMVSTSQSKFMAKVEKAMKDGEVAEQPWASQAVQGWLMPAKKALDEYLDDYRGKKGHQPPVLKYVDVIGSEAAILIAMRVILHTGAMESKFMKARATSLAIADKVVDEYAVTLMAKDLDDKEFQRIKQQAAKSSRTRAKKMLAAAEKQGYIEEVSEPTKLKVGATLVELIVNSTDLAEYRKEDVVNGRVTKTEKSVVLTDEALHTIDSAIDRALYSPEMGYWPMVVPPKQWSHDKKGGYITGPVRRTYGLIRTRGRNHRKGKDLPQHAPEVYQAINRLQDTPFRVNKDVLRVLDEMVASDLTPPKMQSPDDIEQVEFPQVEQDALGHTKVITGNGETYEQGTEGWSKYWTAFYREREQRQEIKDKLKGNLYEGQRAMAVASMFKDYPRFYFPWKADFRGRLYALPQGLNPQGSKVAQGLLEFAEGKRVGERGVYWLHVHAAGVFGEDKLTLDERYQWAVDNTHMMLRVAKDPIGMAYWWGKADKPYQFLAVCLAWPDVYTKGPDHVSHIPVAVDGTCNGLQHLSAISRDRKTAELVNLAPGDRPQDVYGVTADATKAIIETIELDEEDNKLAHSWLKFGVDRKIAKRPVMTQPYGSTYFAVGDFVMEIVRERMGASMEHPFPGTLHEAVSFLKPHLWTAIQQTIPGARQTMEWLQGATKDASKANLPMSWTTPDGFNVTQAYHKDKRKQVDLLVDGGRLRLDTYEMTDEIDPGKQKMGIVPNFVHSMDGCHARMYVNHAAERGVSAFMMVHDDYRSHASDVDCMNSSIRETFIQMYGSDVTKPLLDSLAEQGTPYGEELILGDFDINEVRESVYFFG